MDGGGADEDVGADAMEAAAVRAAAERLSEYVMVAAREVVPSNRLSVFSRERIRLAMRLSGPDMFSRAPSALWRQLTRNGSVTGGIELATVSAYGVQRVAFYASVDELSRALIAALPDETWSVAANVRVGEEGVLLVTTHLQASRQQLAGRLQCALCGDFLSNTRGLRDHQQVKHGQTYEVAVEATATARGALIPYVPPHTVAAALAQLWAARAADDEREKRSIPALLAAARDGRLDEVRQQLRLLDKQEGHDGGDTAALVAAAATARETTDRHGSSALHWAAGSGRLDVCRFLVAQLGLGVDSTGQQKDRRTPLHWAARNGKLECCKWLVELGADPNSATVDGTTPLHWAVWRGELEVAAWLVEVAGADLHAVNSFGCNAIQWASQSDDADGLPMCRWLRERSLDIGLLNRNGHSAVHKAAVKGNAAACKWLLGSEGGLGIRHLQPDGDGNTPSVMARLEGHAELAEWLEREEHQREAAASCADSCAGSQPPGSAGSEQQS
jgi:ankyrin repeat protein